MRENAQGIWFLVISLPSRMALVAIIIPFATTLVGTGG
jgi:hypothetical protein